MATTKVKLIDPEKEEMAHTHRDNWEVMKPFVHFSVKAMKVIALGLITILRALPLLKPRDDKNTGIKRR